MDADADEIIAKHRLDSTSWTHKGFHGLPFTFYYIGLGPLKPCRDYYGDSCTKTMFFVKEDYVRWYWPDDDMRRLRSLLIKNVNQDPSYLERMRSQWEARLREFDRLLERMERTELSELSDERLFSLYDEFLEKYMAEFGIVMTVQDAFSMYSAEFLEPRFKELIRKDFTQTYTALLSPVEDSFINEERKSRLAIQKARLAGEEVGKMLAEHQRRFFWIRNNYAKQQVLGMDFFRREIEAMTDDPEQELARIEKERADIKAKKKRLIKELGLGQEDINLVKTAELFAYIQDERKKYVLIANHHERRFIAELAHRRGLTEKQVEYAIYPETKGKPDAKLLDLRRKGCVCIQDEQGVHLYEGAEVEEVHKRLFGGDEGVVTELKGIAASPGKARGPVRIVLKTHDLANFAQGDILVASMTRPEMVVAMQKAAAIVTDEGGITSHAAIVSRELKIPCVIGTGNATRIFKDGDLVEVDAEKGVVRRVDG